MRNALYRNNRDGTFTDVTEKAGVARRHASAWASPSATTTATACPTSIVTPYGRSILYHNNGDGTFTDVTAKAGVGRPGMDHQRRLVRLRQRRPARPLRLQLRRLSASREQVSAATSRRGERYYCIPRVFNPTASLLFHNNGDGTFTDVSKASGIASVTGKGLGRGRHRHQQRRLAWICSLPTTPSPNFLFVNRGQGKFEEIGLPAGVAYSEDGRARSGMGVDAADFDQDGWQDLFVANVDQEMLLALSQQ